MVKVELDKASKRQMEATLKEFSRLTGKGVEEGVREISKSSARRLAATVQPYGLTEAKGAKFMKSIGIQIDQAWYGTNMGAFPATNDMAKAHQNARNARGVVPKRQFRKEKGKKWLNLISVGQKEAYKRKQIKKAGRAKAAWIAAGEAMGVGKITGIAKWIREDVSGGYAKSNMAGKGLKAEAVLTNETPYIRPLQTDRQVSSALAGGLKNGYKRLEYIIKNELKKLPK
jgi:hypothetical protein